MHTWKSHNTRTSLVIFKGHIGNDCPQYNRFVANVGESLRCIKVILAAFQSNDQFQTLESNVMIYGLLKDASLEKLEWTLSP